MNQRLKSSVRIVQMQVKRYLWLRACKEHLKEIATLQSEVQKVDQERLAKDQSSEGCNAAHLKETAGSNKQSELRSDLEEGA